MSLSVSPYGQRAVRSGIATYLAGRGFSAVLTFTAFALAARLLNLTEYGIYAAALALLELGLALSSVGLDWVATRSLPEYRMHAGGRATVIVVLRLFVLQAVILTAIGALVANFAAALATTMQLTGAAAPFQLLGLLLAVEGVGRLSRDQMLGILMHQRAGQLAQVIRAGTLATLLGWALHSQAAIGSKELLHFELIAAASSALGGAALLAHALWRLWPQPVGDPTWQAPASRQLWRLALHTYGSYLLALAYGPQVLTMLIARLLGAEAVAIFGFARGFADQVRRYLPTDLLQSVIRPALIAHYSTTRDFQELMLRLGLWLKSSLILLLPLLAFFSAFGALGAAALGGEHFRSAWPVLLLMLCGAGMMAWRRIVELACNTVLAPDICVRAAAWLLLAPPVMFGVLAVTGSLLGAIAVLIAAEAGFCLRALQLLHRRGFTYAWPKSSFTRLLGGLLLTITLLMLIHSYLMPPLGVAVIAAGTVSLTAIVLLRPLSVDEYSIVTTWSPSTARWLSRQKRDGQ